MNYTNVFRFADNSLASFVKQCNIKTIIFDFGGVILNINYNKTREAFNNLGIVDFDDMYSQKNADPLFSNLEEGKLNEQEFYKSFRRSTNLPLTNQQIAEAWNQTMILPRKVSSPRKRNTRSCQ